MEIVLKLGVSVTGDSVIFRSETPELNQKIESAQQELVQNKANLRRFKLNNQKNLK